MSEATESTVRRLLGEIAADADMSALSADTALRDELDLDSMDMLHFAIALNEAFGVEVPESAYSQLSTIASTVAYVETAAAS